MNVVFVASEAVPFAKTGGLADVTGSLFKGMKKGKFTISMFLPCYRSIRDDYDLTRSLSGLKVRLGNRMFYFDVYHYDEDVYFIANEYFFDRDGYYGDSRGDFPDNAERFAFYGKAVLITMNRLGMKPDIVHLHDWQTGLIPFFMKEYALSPETVRSVFTIHNIGYQGAFSRDTLNKIGIAPEYFSMEGLEFYGKLSFLKGGIIYSDRITTVSPAYEKELLTPDFGYGFDGLLRKKGVKGILNGIDSRAWDPERDDVLDAPYSMDDMSGKRTCKESLCKRLEFKDPSRPLLGVVSRFSAQKGMDIIASALDEIIGLGVNLSILGKGDRSIEKLIYEKAILYPERISLKIGFDEPLARRIYGASDFFLMPSRYEPCGVAQMIAMRYGSIPIVRRTGGLADTVSDFHTANPDGRGFTFRHADRDGLVDCIKRALCFYRHREDRETIVTNGMSQDFSWDRSISQYIDLYSGLAGDR